MRRTRWWVALLCGIALGGSAAACSGSGGAASSPFCSKAVEVARLGKAAEAVDDTDAASTQKAWTSYIAVAVAAAPTAPSDMSDTYRTYTTWLQALGAALQRHEYSFGAAIGDSEFVAATDQDAVNSARGAVDAYVRDTCKADVSS